jgi:adenosine deaminase
LAERSLEVRMLPTADTHPRALLQPFAALPFDPAIRALPKADLHVHAETDARLDRVLAQRLGTPATDWHARTARAMADTPPGEARLQRWAWDTCRPSAQVDALDADPELFVERIADLLRDGAADGALLVEVRFGRATVLRPDFLPLFRVAEQRVRADYPAFRAAAIIAGVFPQAAPDAARDPLLEACVAAARDGLAGVDFIPQPYSREADWRGVYAWAERLADAGLGMTAHAGEFSVANLRAASAVPGLTRLGHAVHAVDDPWLVEQLATRPIVVECCLTSNVVLGAVASYVTHPIRRLLAAGVPVVLGTDDPVRVCTTIGREYMLAAHLGIDVETLAGFTTTALESVFGSGSETGSTDAPHPITSI